MLKPPVDHIITRTSRNNTTQYSNGMLWLCSSYGCVQGMAVFKLWLCSRFGCVQAMAVFKVWVCSSYGCVQGMGVFKVWVCSRYGCVQAKCVWVHMSSPS